MLTFALVRQLQTELLGKLGVRTPKTAACNVDLNGSMRTTAGRANYRTNTIHLNTRLLNANPHHIYQTVAHELAHLVAVELHGTKATGHGVYWCNIMRQFGVSPDRCHTLDVSGLRRRHKTHDAYCNCLTPHKLKTGRYNKMRRGVQFRCRVCQAILKLDQPTTF